MKHGCFTKHASTFWLFGVRGISNFAFFTRSNCQPSKLVGEIWLTSHRYHRNFPLDLGFTLKTRARFGSFWKSRFSQRCGPSGHLSSSHSHCDLCDAKMSGANFQRVFPVFFGIPYGYDSPSNHSGQVRMSWDIIHWEITNFRCMLLGEPSWKSFHGCWIVAKEHSSVSKQLLQPVFLGDFGRHLKETFEASQHLSISPRGVGAQVLQCTHVCSSHYVRARILQNTWQSHFQYRSLFFMALGIFVFIFQANLQPSRVVFWTGLNLWTNMFPCFELFWPRAEEHATGEPRSPEWQRIYVESSCIGHCWGKARGQQRFVMYVMKPFI